MLEAQLDRLLKPLIKPAVWMRFSTSDAAQLGSCVSKMGGLPYAEKNQAWPHCPTCKNALEFIAQIKQPNENALQTFFYCFECSPWGMSTEEEGQWLIRSYQNPTMDRYSAITSTKVSEYKVSACACSEHRVQTLPDWDSLESLAPHASALCRQINSDEPWDVYEAAILRNGCVADYATLLGGYPKWIQGQTTATCPLCDADMEFFAQLDSEEEANVMWGDCGAVYLFRCARHQQQFGFELQCY